MSMLVVSVGPQRAQRAHLSVSKFPFLSFKVVFSTKSCDQHTDPRAFSSPQKETRCPLAVTSLLPSHPWQPLICFCVGLPALDIACKCGRNSMWPSVSGFFYSVYFFWYSFMYEFQYLIFFFNCCLVLHCMDIPQFDYLVTCG